MPWLAPEAVTAISKAAKSATLCFILTLLLLKFAANLLKNPQYHCDREVFFEIIYDLLPDSECGNGRLIWLRPEEVWVGGGVALPVVVDESNG